MDTPLFNFLNRQQVYVEGVKNWYVSDLNRYLKLLADKIRSIMSKLGIKEMGELSKTKFNNLLNKLFDSVNKVMGQYGTEILQELQRFSRIDLGLQRSAFAFIKPTIDLSVVKVGGLWSAVKDAPVPAFGGTLKEGVTALATKAKLLIKTKTTMSYADNETLIDATQALVGTDIKYTDGAIKNIANDVRGYIRTAFQHVTSKVSEKLGELVYSCYQWCSVLDDKTSAICQDRNGNIYRYGGGPQPPAHPNCRSRTIPCGCSDGLGTVPTFFTWLTDQSLAFLEDAFGDTFARDIKSGKAKASDLGKFSDYPALNVDDFALKASFLTD